MVLVDTSSWIETLRVHGNAAVRRRIGELVLEGKAAWCNIVRLELWHGARGAREKDALEELEEVVGLLEINDGVWARSIQLGRMARASGLTVQTPDLLIVATAQFHEVQMDSCDGHFDRLIRLG